MRALTGILLALLLATPAVAADPSGAGPGTTQRSCSQFDNWFIWGDPTDCPRDETVPVCDAPAVVSAARAFVARAEPVYLVPEIAEMGRIVEQAQSLPRPSPLVRRYCSADVVLTDGSRTTAYYFVEEDAGFVGIGWKVYVCLLGRDRWRIYDGDCRVARPAVVY